MCNLYQPSLFDKVDQRFLFRGVGRDDVRPYVAPRDQGPFIRGNEVVVGKWGLIPGFSPSSRAALPNGKHLSTNNARSETMATAPTFASSWRKGRRCLVPVSSYFEPYWGANKRSTRWRFWRADGEEMMLAGLWRDWVDTKTGEVYPSYTMITQNCNSHPLLSLMHKPERDEFGDIKPLELQDKRSAVIVEKCDWDTWLHGTVEEALALIRLSANDLLHHGPYLPHEPVYLPGLPSSLWPHPERIETTEGLEAIARMPQDQSVLF